VDWVPGESQFIGFREESKAAGISLGTSEAEAGSQVLTE